MKRIVWIIVGLIALIGVVFWQHDRIPVLRDIFHEEESATQYTCPMHPQIISDRPGACPICGMTLQPIKKTDLSTHPHPAGSFHLTPERRQLIGVQLATVQVQSLQTELRLPGRIAFDQALYVAETEYVAALNGGADDVLPVIEKKLVRLGISDEELSLLKIERKRDESLVTPKQNGPFWVYASVYEADLSRVSAGMKASVNQWSGEVKQVEPVVDPVTRTTQARILILSSDQPIKPETYVDVILKKDLGEMLSVPADAVIDTGMRKIVFVDLGEGYLEPREVTLGEKAGANFPVITGLKNGEIVVTSAQFLLDSESQIQSALKQFGEKTKGHQH